MWQTTARELAELIGGELVGDGERPIGAISLDSRERMSPDTVFWGISGQRFNGSAYANEASKQGAGVVVVESDGFVRSELHEGTSAILVADTTVALHVTAAEARRRFQGLVIAITGSNGKTTVKEMLRSALGSSMRVAASPMSWNSQVGVALSLLNLPENADVALIECGISKPGEMQTLEAIVRPDRGIFVNVGLAHRETLIDSATTAREKASLFARIPREGWVLVPADEDLAIAALSRANSIASIIQPNLSELGVTVGSDKKTFSVWGEGAKQEERFTLDAAVAVLLSDVALTLAAAKLLGMSPVDALRGLQSWQPAGMRLERLTTPDGVYVINDAYSADFESVTRAIRALENESGDGRRIAVFGGLAQLGQARASTHEAIGRLVAKSTIQKLIVVGEYASEISDSAVDCCFDRADVEHVENSRSAAALLATLTRPGDMVLVKGSRPARLEETVNLLLTPLAPAKVYVDLEQLAENLDTLRTLVGPGVQLMPVVKSFGYGLDSRKLAETYEASGADALAVAYPDEGVMLRKHGVKLPIMVQNVLFHEVSKVVEHRLDAQIADLELAKRLGAHASAAGRSVSVHLKVDTGMGRAGVSVREACGLARALKGVSGVDLVGLMTHLAAADEAQHDEFTRGQIAAFAAVRDELEREGMTFRYVHAANSAGAVRFPEARFSMVRSGIGLVGYLDMEAPETQPFRPVIRFVSQVVSVRELEREHPVGYGLSWRTSEEHQSVAVVAVGYNDGYPRHLSNRGWMSVHGVRCPVVGKVCMDVTMLDVSAIREDVRPGDEVVIYGTRAGEPQLTEMASLADTIAYELLTRLSPRVRRIYQGVS